MSILLGGETRLYMEEGLSLKSVCLNTACTWGGFISELYG